MARVWRLVTALLLGSPPLISGHSYSVGKCPHFSPMQDFNWDKVGRWPGHYCLNCHQPECSSSRRGSGTSLPKRPPAGGVSRRLSRRMRMVLKVSSRYLVPQIFCNLLPQIGPTMIVADDSVPRGSLPRIERRNRVNFTSIEAARLPGAAAL